jgi:hypothetical protein
MNTCVICPRGWRYIQFCIPNSVRPTFLSCYNATVERTNHRYVKLAPELVKAFTSVLVSRRDMYPFQQPDGRYVTVRRPLNSALVEGHLKGHITLGAYALAADSQAKWLCFDADEKEEWDGLLDLARSLSDKDVPSYLERSRRYGHLWIFLPTMPGRDARRLGKQLIVNHNLSPKIELFPKQDELSTGPGSLVRMPLGVHRKTGKRYPFITLQGEPLANTIREQVAILSNPD